MRGPLKRHIRSLENPADLLTKVIMGEKSKHLVSSVLYDIYDGDTKQWANKFFSCASKTVSCLNNLVFMNTLLKELGRFGW